VCKSASGTVINTALNSLFSEFAFIFIVWDINKTYTVIVDGTLICVIIENNNIMNWSINLSFFRIA